MQQKHLTKSCTGYVKHHNNKEDKWEEIQGKSKKKVKDSVVQYTTKTHQLENIKE